MPTQLDEGVLPLPALIIDARWQVFLRVAAAGSLSKGATALAMPQSMVSRAITHLERQCGERLFVRTGRGVVLTEFGAQLLPRMARLALDAGSSPTTSEPHADARSARC